MFYDNKEKKLSNKYLSNGFVIQNIEEQKS